MLKFNLQLFALNYAEKYAAELMEISIQETLCSPFITSNVKWLNAKTFHFTQMSTSGYKNHSRSGGWNAGTYNQADVPFTLTHDRDIQFLIDKIDVDETNLTASIQNISGNFVKTQAAPEMDALFFSTVATEALAVTGLASAFTLASFDTTNVYSRLKAMLKAGRLRAYKQEGNLIMYIKSDIMDLLEQSKDFTRQINVTQIAEGGAGIESRVTFIDSIPVIEVIDDERFCTEFDFTDGFEKALTGYDINVLIASTKTVKVVPKINSIYFFNPGDHTEGDGYLYQNRSLMDVFVMPNGKKDDTIDSVFVNIDAAALPED